MAAIVETKIAQVEAKETIGPSDLLKRICVGKIKAKDDVAQYTITHPNNGDWYDAIEEARGRGVSIKAFGDTSDKVVLHPGHLGHEFDYFWGAGHWSSTNCWDEDADKEKAHNELWAVAKELVELKYVVWIVLPSGNSKGYLSTKILKKAQWKKYTSLDEILVDHGSQDAVLFVFKFNPQKYIT